jgi:CelD/BcsL family acetyltransferase involved in cellulose biosynthesis
MRVERHDRIESIASEWDELADRVDAAPWLRPGWVGAWYAAFGDQSPLELFAVRAGGQLVGVLPMLRRRRGLTPPANWHTPEFRPIAVDPEAASALLEAALADRPRSLTLSWIAPEDLEPARSASHRAGYRVLERTLMRSPYLPLDPTGPSTTETKVTVKEPRSSTVRRHQRKLAKQGELRLDVDLDTDNLEGGFEIEASGWKGEHGSAIISQPQTRIFYERVAGWAAGQGLLRLFFLRLDERPIAFVLSFEHHSRLYYIKGGFDAAFRKFGPGAIITHEMIAYARREKLSSFEFLGGEDPWKVEWTSQVRERRLFQAFAPAPAGLAQWALYAWVRPAVKQLLSVRSG